MKSESTPTPSGSENNNKKPASGRRFIFTVIKTVIISLVTLFCVAAGIIGGAIAGYINTAEPIKDEQLVLAFNKTTFIYDDKGNAISKLTGKDNRDSEPVSDKQAPKFLKDAIISIEDERFETHSGIDIKGIINVGFSLVKNIITNNVSATRGGSTITQQVVKNLTGNTQRSLQRKVQEWYAAIQLEKKYSKWQILEMYMNISYWGHSCYGVQSASKKYFGKDVLSLSLGQCALLAGITNNPGTYDPFTEKGRAKAKGRQETILKKMLDLGKIDQNQYEQAHKEDLKYALHNEEAVKAASVQSYFVDQVITDVKEALMKDHNMSSTLALTLIYNGGLEIYTTMDPDIQASMDAVFLDDKYFPDINKDAIKFVEHPQAAMVILDAENGQVKALYGGYGKKEGNNIMNRASSSLMRRSPGSSIKPIAIYAPAIDMHLITPATVIDDKPVYMLNGKDANKLYPTNYDGRYDGLTSVRNALKSSVNVVAAQVWRDILTPNNSIAYLKKVGIDRSDEKWLSLALGGLYKGVNPLQMAAAYIPFAHGGMYYEPATFTMVKDNQGKVLIDKKPKYEAVYSEQTAFLMEDMMKGVTKPRDSPYPHGGTAASFVNEKIIGMTVAGKTGTTSDNRDKWFVGYTPYYVAATWYGYDNKVVPITLQSAEYNQALKIWAAVMANVHKNLKPRDFPVVTGMVKKTICIYSGKMATRLCALDPRGNATRVEYFIKGTEPKVDDFCNVHIQAKVCTVSQYNLFGYKVHLLAGPYCPPDKVVEKVFIQRQVPYIPLIPGERAPKDVAYELAANGGEYCNIHGAPVKIQTGTKDTKDTKDTKVTKDTKDPL